MQHTFHVQNLKCGGCANTIITRLKEMTDVETVSVNNTTDSVSFNYTKEETIGLVSDELSNLGYPIEGASNPIIKKAKSFVSCAVGRFNS